MHPDLPAHPCYLNGAYTPLNEAKVSVLDRGFIFGDGVYEVLPVYAGHTFRFEHHMVRLERSLAEMRIRNPHTREVWHHIAMQLVAAQAVNTWTTGSFDAQNAALKVPGDYFVYFQVTRGVALRDHPMPAGITPTVFGMCSPLKPATAQQRAQGVACVTADDFRWQKAHIKSTSLLGSVFARQISVDADAVETVMFRGDFLSEAAHSNVWVVKNNTVYGPPKDNLVLEGIRYGLIDELCQASGIGFSLRTITREEVLTCDEILLSSATKEILPVTRLDGQAVGQGAAKDTDKGVPGPVYQKLYAAYQMAKAESAAAANSAHASGPAPANQAA
jgi:D-alanine transaminase